MEKEIINGSISEMSDSDTGISLDKKMIEELKKDDKNPMFVTVEVMNPQVSKNGRYYDEKTLYSIAEQINEKKPDGYMGHLTEEERLKKMPHSQTMWLGANVKEVAGKQRLYAKGYVLPYAKELRTYLRKAKVIGKKVAVSIYGKASMVWDSQRSASRIKEFVLENLDWARAGAEGLQTAGITNIASEMQGNNNDSETLKRISEMSDTIDAFYEDYIDNQLNKKVNNRNISKLFKKLVISEMIDEAKTKKNIDSKIDHVLNSDESKSILQTLSSRSGVISPGEDNRAKNISKYIT
jgi:hypothetical protein